MNSPKHSSIGTATDQTRALHKFRGSAAKTNKSGSATITPSVSPIHHVVQFDGRSPDQTTPSTNIPANERLVLIAAQATARARDRAGYPRGRDSRSRGAVRRRQAPLGLWKRAR